ncbi:hypothetical protein TNCV_561001 [Trichonephila clavipes]|nr:hypothetical protein TNCV_561001 [Trichonephila clavipes]
MFPSLPIDPRRGKEATRLCRFTLSWALFQEVEGWPRCREMTLGLGGYVRCPAGDPSVSRRVGATQEPRWRGSRWGM